MRVIAALRSDPMAMLGLERARAARRAAALAAVAPVVSPATAAQQQSVIEQVIAPLSVVEHAGDSAPTIGALTTRLSGRLVRAGEPNQRGAQFEVADLQYGLPSLVGSPLTYNHVEDRGAYGWIAEAAMAEDPEQGTHIAIVGYAWTGRFAGIRESLATSLESGTASLSMECMGSSVICLTCNIEAAAAEGQPCQHILTKTGPRRMVKPTFYGAALILDGVTPAWGGASLHAR